VQHLICDDELEEYIISNDKLSLMPKLKEINYVSVKIIDPAVRERERNIRDVMRKLWKYAGTYRIVTEEQMDEENIWYINDEVGSSIRHSDVPNFAVHPFIYAPNNKFDAHTITYSIAWPLADLADGDVIFRDFLKGFDETKFRSTRFTVWFNTPEEYFVDQLKIYRSIKPAVDAQ
jgi:tubulin--tyrosine ligase-like protein 12